MRSQKEALLTLHQDQHASLMALDTLLSEEYAALKQKDIGQITEYTTKKQRLLDTIGQLDSQCRTVHSQSAVKPTQKIPGHDALAEIKVKINTLIKKCHHQNRINGGMITASQYFYSKVLDIIVNGKTNPQLYEASGKSQGKFSSSQSLAKI